MAGGVANGRRAMAEAPEALPLGEPADDVVGTGWAPAPAAAPDVDPLIAERARRRRAAEAAADAAEAAAADAANRAATAIAAAARAAEDAEAAAEAAAVAAEAAAQAAAAERHAMVRSEHRNLPRPVPQVPRQVPRPVPQPVPQPNPQPSPQPNPQPSSQPTPRVVPQHAAGPRDEGPDERPTVVRPRHPAPEPGAGAGVGQAGPPVPTSGATGPTTIPALAAGGGRAARRRAQEAAAAVAREATRDPVTEVFSIDSEPFPEPAAQPDADAGDTAAPSRRRTGKGGTAGERGARLGSPVALAAAGVGAVLVVVAVLVATAGGAPAPTPDPAPAAVIGSAAGPTDAGLPGANGSGANGSGANGSGASDAASETGAEGGEVDATSAEAVAFLDAMREADIPTSRSGRAETEAAVVICERLEQGTDEETLVRSLPAVLPAVTGTQSSDVVQFAQEHYC